MEVHSGIIVALVASLALAGSMSGAGAEGTPVSGLRAVYRSGQVFLTWQEAETPAGTTFNVYVHSEPITPTNLARASKVGHHVERHSARDWWQDPASFDAKADPGTPTGFRIESGAAPLDPGGGLFVHTVTAASAGRRYFAVTLTGPDGKEDATLVPGLNSLEQPVEGSVAPVQAIWLPDTPAPAADSAKGRSLTLYLHGRGGGKTAGAGAQQVNCLMFGTAKQGWREGLPFKFQLSVAGDGVRITPCDRTWAGRPVKESPDGRDHCPAVSTFWYGCNSRIYETTHTERTVAPNYTEEQLLGMVRWAQETLGTDPNRTYIIGGSMGGSGAVSMCMHHPKLFAAAVAQVPVVAYTRRGGGAGSQVRLECACGPLDETAVDQEGRPLLQWMNGEIQAGRAPEDLPYLFVTNGRTDGSIPWENNPAFYRAMNAARQGLSVYWNNEDHGGVEKACPPDVRAWGQRLARYALNQSFPAFSNCSDNRNPGSGDKKDGDIVGWWNRGLDWKDVVDTPQEYALTITAAHPDLQLPVTVDITPRRLQRFLVRPGEKVQVAVGAGAPQPAKVDDRGLVTVAGVKIESAEGTRIRIEK